jgi:hypothetical protein
MSTRALAELCLQILHGAHTSEHRNKSVPTAVWGRSIRGIMRADQFLRSTHIGLVAAFWR